MKPEEIKISPRHTERIEISLGGAKQAKFDVMLHDRFVCTMTYKLTFPHMITEEELTNYVEGERPSLRGKDYNIAFVTRKPIWRN